VQFGEAVYRRRIEQPKPEPKYVPFRWEDREQLRGRWVVQVESTGTEQMVNKLDLINNDLFANNKLALELLTGWRFLDTGEPVGKRVMQ
jgi:nitrate reductase beta subunit